MISKDLPNQVNIEVVQEGNQDWLFEQRETQKQHTAYEWEKMLFSCLRDGNVDRLDQVITAFSSAPLMVGRLSSNDLRQAQYLAVAFMTLATRAAIEGGMYEMDAYNKSDLFIQTIDGLKDSKSVFEAVFKMVKDTTEEMRGLQFRRNYSKPVKDCLEYIYHHLHLKITLQELAKVACLSPQYLSFLFHKEVGSGVYCTILKLKVTSAKELLLQSDLSSQEISAYLNFSSQSHFISCFKREFGMTPRQFKEQFRK